MNDKRNTKISKFLSRILRHAPGDIGLTLEPGGWVSVADLITGAAHVGMRITREELSDVVRNSDKQRFAFDESGTRIRANQGHTTEVELHFDVTEPVGELFHGTADRNLNDILKIGILKMARHHVHLSPDVPTAYKVGKRHGHPVVLVVDAIRMHADGHVFYLSANNVWLVDHVPAQYLRVLSTE
jgi:putative RNA 2'-phosphotransferase